MIFTGGISVVPYLGVDSWPVLPIFPLEDVVECRHQRQFIFSGSSLAEAAARVREQRDERVEEGREKAKKKQLPVCL